MKLPKPIAESSPSGATPDWAESLPAYETLRYTQTLLVTGGLVVVAAYLAVRGADHPAAIVRAVRKKTGV